MTMSDPFMPPFGLKPKPTQPVVLTVSLNVMSPCNLSKPHFRQTKWFWSRYSMKGMVGSDASALCVATKNMQSRGSRECMMSLCCWRASNWAHFVRRGQIPSHPSLTHLQYLMNLGDTSKEKSAQSYSIRPTHTWPSCSHIWIHISNYFSLKFKDFFSLFLIFSLKSASWPSFMSEAWKIFQIKRIQRIFLSVWSSCGQVGSFSCWYQPVLPVLVRPLLASDVWYMRRWRGGMKGALAHWPPLIPSPITLDSVSQILSTKSHWCIFLIEILTWLFTVHTLQLSLSPQLTCLNSLNTDSLPPTFSLLSSFTHQQRGEVNAECPSTSFRHLYLHFFCDNLLLLPPTFVVIKNYF